MKTPHDPALPDLPHDAGLAAETPDALARARDILRFTVGYAAEKKLTQAASSLTFTTVLAIVPLLAVVLASFTAFPLFAEFRQALESFLTESLLPPSVSNTVMRYLNQFAAQASGLTAVGGGFLLVTSILLIMTIDEAFNEIWRVERQRPLRQRLLVYWAIISLGPVLAGASLWASSMLLRESLGYIGTLPEWLGLTLNLVPLAVSALGFTALFAVVPNCRVRWRDALLGGVGTAIVLAIMKAGFTAYLTRFPSYTVIYGAFATLPIFLLWIYLSWLAVLLGATVASMLPALRHRHRASRHRPGTTWVDAVRILEALWRARGALPAGCSPNALEQQLDLHPDTMRQTLHALKDLGYAVPVRDADRWVLACDPARVGIGPLVDRLLIDRTQVGLEARISQALAHALTGDSCSLEDLFGPRLPETDTMRQNIGTHRAASEGNHHAQSQ